MFLVEDEQLFALDLKRRLERFGCEVVGMAATAEEALVCLKTVSPEVILTDIHLQGEVDGVELAETLKRQSTAALIFLTGNADEATLQRAHAASPFNYLLKPVRDGELRITVQAAAAHQRMAAQVRDTHSSLEARVRERTAELVKTNSLLQAQITEQVHLQNELRHTNSILVAAQQSRARFLGDISREFRTPINGMLGCAEMLAETGLTERQKECVGTMRTCGLSLLETVESLLLIAETEAGHVAAAEVEFVLRDHVQRALEHVRSRYGNDAQDFTCDLPPELPTRVFGGAPLLHEILVRLTGYALQSSQGAAVHVQVEKIAEASSRAYLHFCIRTQGTCLGEPLRNRIQRAFTLRNPAERTFEDVPIQLSVVGLLVQVLEGLVWMDHLPGAGDVFNVAVWLQTRP